MDTYAVRLRSRGQLTLPQTVRDALRVDDGDLLTLTRIDGCVFLTPQQLLIPKLTEEFSAIMQQENVTLAELLQDLAEEREQIWRERQATTATNAA